MKLSARELTDQVKGALLQGSPDLCFERYNIDSRLTQPGELFFAIQAERDGHAYVPDALSRGAAGAVISRSIPPQPGETALIRVKDTLGALQSLAKQAASVFRPRVVGITGSVGKTTTKEFAAQLLALAFPNSLLKSDGNFNNHLGLPLTLLRLEKNHKIAVLEYGMSAPGEISTLTRILAPDVAAVTNVRPVHLEFFPDLGEIARAKEELLEGASPQGMAVLNRDDPFVRSMADRWRGRLCTFGLSEGCTIRADHITSLGWDGLSFNLVYGTQSLPARLPFHNRGQLYNFLAAAGIAWAFEVPLECVVNGGERLKAFDKRGRVQLLGQNIHLIDDTYNSNPAALEAALHGLADLPGTRKLAALGDMLELGDDAAAFHRKAGELVAALGIDLLFAVGPLSRHTAEAALKPGGMDPGCVHSFERAQEAAEPIEAALKPGDVILVKGSRSIRMETVVEKLMDRRG
jgi:UDP-N-acetylmuramoyl-tripeptide--D-alanyl-D-alanine ligase